MTSEAENWYSDDAATLGDRIAAAREAAGLSQAQLAGKIGVRKDTLIAWENDRTEPRANRLQMLTGLLGVSLRWLLTGVGDGPDDSDGLQAIPQDINAMLTEMRALRAQIARASVKLGEVEKRMRKALSQ